MIILNWITVTNPYRPGIHDKDVSAFVDDTLTEFSKFNSAEDFDVFIGQSIVIMAFRLAIREKKIDYKNIVIRLNGIDIQFNRFANLTRWPVEFLEYDILLEKLLFFQLPALEKETLRKQEIYYDYHKCTCERCSDRFTCEYAFDLYNSQGDCLKLK